MSATRRFDRRIRGALAIASTLLLLLLCLSGRAVGEDDAINSARRAKETLIFQDNFEDLDPSVWKHDISMSGGGNWEFQYYTNNRSNSFVDDGVLHLQPTLTSDLIGDACVTGDQPFTMNLWGMTPADQCTSNAFYGCERASNKAARHAINPVQSAKLTTVGRFNVKYGRVEVEAKLPKGDWLWPAIWLLPEDNAYGSWPASGEIDVVESRGNSKGYCSEGGGDDPSLCPGGSDMMSSTLHWGPFPALNGYPRTTGSLELKDGKSFGDDFHVFGLSWSEDGLYTYVDEEENRVLDVVFDKPFWERGEFDRLEGVDNPWAGRTNAAPFDRGFYLIMNVAVGGVGGFFPDKEGGKPWTDSDPDAPLRFWEAKDQWYNTWERGDSALQVKSVHIWQKPEGDHWTKGECQCSDNGQKQQQQQEKQDVEPWGDSASAGHVDTSYPTAPPDANSTLRFMMAATLINSLVLLAAMAVWGTAVCGWRCSACAGAGGTGGAGARAGVGRGKLGGRVGYRLAGSTDPMGEGRGEVEVGSSGADSIRRHGPLGGR